MKVLVAGASGAIGKQLVPKLVANGHEVIGVDLNLSKVEMINVGRSPVIEVGLENLIADAVAANRIRATTNSEEAVYGSDISMICVGTPSHGNGSLDLTQIEKVCQEIGVALAGKAKRHVVVVRSTILPGTTEQLVIPVCASIPNSCGRGVPSRTSTSRLLR